VSSAEFPSTMMTSCSPSGSLAKTCGRFRASLSAGTTTVTFGDGALQSDGKRWRHILRSRNVVHRIRRTLTPRRQASRRNSSSLHLSVDHDHPPQRPARARRRPPEAACRSRSACESDRMCRRRVYSSNGLPCNQLTTLRSHSSRIPGGHCLKGHVSTHGPLASELRSGEDRFRLRRITRSLSESDLSMGR
jgi:hypothetical protein